MYTKYEMFEAPVLCWRRNNNNNNNNNNKGKRKSCPFVRSEGAQGKHSVGVSDQPYALVAFHPEKNTHCTGSYEGPRAGMDVSEKRKSFAPAGIRNQDGIDCSQVVKHSNLTL